MSVIMPKVPKTKDDPAQEAAKQQAAAMQQANVDATRQRQLASMGGKRGSMSLASNAYRGYSLNPMSASLGAGRRMA